MKKLFLLLLLGLSISADTVTLSQDEQTILITKETTVNEVLSFQVVSGYKCRWSSIPLNDTNAGGLAAVGDEKVFSAAHTIYFKATAPTYVQIRKVGL